MYYPDETTPLLRVDVDPDSTPEEWATCAYYWQFAQPGTWDVSSLTLGSSRLVTETVKSRSKAILLTVRCPTCKGPTEIANRSALNTLRLPDGRLLWSQNHPERFPREPIAGPEKCAECVERDKVSAAARVEAQRISARNFGLVDECQYGASTLAHLAALVLSERITLSEPLPPLASLDYTFTQSSETDRELFKELWHAGWLIIHGSTKLDAFEFDSDDNATGVYLAKVAWVFSDEFADNWTDEDDSKEDALSLTKAWLSAPTGIPEFYTPNEQDAIEVIRALIRSWEAAAVANYIDGLLVKQYRREAVPDHKRADLSAAIGDGFDAGFNFRQLMCLAWQAVSRAISWGERESYARPHVAAATVKHFVNGINWSQDGRIVEQYSVPAWIKFPLLYKAAHDIVDRFDSLAAKQERDKDTHYSELRSLLNVHTMTFHPGWGGPCERCDSDEVHTHYLGEDMPQADRPSATPLDTIVRFAAIDPDGVTRFVDGTRQEMQDTVGHGCGAERVELTGLQTLRAYVCGMPGAGCNCKPNPGGEEIVALLGGGMELRPDTVVFFQLAYPFGEAAFTSIDSEHQRILEAAQRAATPYFLRTPSGR
jgi:hypothetical protein